MKTIIGIISYNDLHYLEKTLPTIYSLPDSKIIILDNAGNDEIKKFVKRKYPKIEFIRHKDVNIGFSKGHNYILEKSPKSDYYFCLNSDILIEKDGFNACIDFLDKNKDVCIASSKLYYWDFIHDKKTNIIDTLGIIGNTSHHFWDRGQGKIDNGQYDNAINNVFGISGAAFIIRRSCVKKLHGSDHKIFDENIFMYKDDVDLAYRMRWQALQIQFLPNVLGYHARTASRRSKKSNLVLKMSYRNHLILMRNNFSFRYSLHTKLMTFLYEILRFFYFLIKSPKVVSEFVNVRKMKNIHKAKKIISPRKMEKFLLN